ncbi:MAG TPA: DNA primase small subunit PriS [Methanomicrobiales archaeon]|nr:DNA primase small subunit PriS [Methanomicrobiales archaeon]
MRPATTEFLRQRFTEYYRRERIMAPPSVGEREFGFILFDPDSPEVRMRRHMGFGTAGELGEYLRSMVPAHAFYSSAYYTAPGAGTMAEKGWTGADLIFDLDADHLMRGPYRAMLDRVKLETQKLLAMLTGELGFSERIIHLVFSGGRGYHVHIRDIGVRGWGSQERRELIDYVCGIGIDPGALLSGVRGGTPGWSERYISTISEYLLWLKGLGREKGVEHLMEFPGIGRERAPRFFDAIDTYLAGLGRGDSGPLAENQVFAAISAGGKFQELLRGRAALADEPVTTDTRRLIRMPTSLHGGSGFRVTPLALGDFDSFDPLRDAVVFSDRPVKVESGANISMEILGNRYQVDKGTSAVPEALAVFLCARGLAEIAGEGGHGPR